MYNIIKQADKGDGADITTIMNEHADAEHLIQKLKEVGDIFEPQPGKLKVLE